MRKAFSFICLLSSVLCSLVRASEPLDLGSGLTYLRIHSLPKSAGDLNAALLRPVPLVLDLRYTADEPDTANILRVLNSQPAKPRLYVLVSPATPAALAEVIATTSARLLTLGVRNSLPAPQVVVEQTAAADRRAYDALEAGMPVAALISGKIEKERYDEATLMSEFKNGNLDPEPPPGPDPTAAKPEPPAPAKDAPPVDRVLQRAVHLQQALLALRRTAG